MRRAAIVLVLFAAAGTSIPALAKMAQDEAGRLVFAALKQGVNARRDAKTAEAFKLVQAEAKAIVSDLRKRYPAKPKAKPDRLETASNPLYFELNDRIKGAEHALRAGDPPAPAAVFDAMTWITVEQQLHPESPSNLDAPPAQVAARMRAYLLDLAKRP
ncbi:MAG: hypothetical protein HY075_15345 [Deltaproteobacteria bacterium]|nr:hypothetical protein [Deltaproteobacteria bacterium]